MVELVVNGVLRSVGAPADTPLLWVLRDDLEDASAKYGCGLDQCGSCRVLVDGVARSSCRLPIGELGGSEVTTLLGLRGDPAATAVQAALLAHNAGQCGYCLPGMVVTLTALVRRARPVPRDDVRRALDDHLCRCGAHPRILRAAFELLDRPSDG